MGQSNLLPIGTDLNPAARLELVESAGFWLRPVLLFVFRHLYIERFHRSLKEEEVWLNEYQNFDQAERSIARWIEEYNHDRPHRGLHGQTPHNARARFALTLTSNMASL